MVKHIQTICRLLLLETLVSQLVFSCLKSTKETVQYKKKWNIFKINNKNTRATSDAVFVFFVVAFEHILHPFSSVSFVDF